MKNLMYEKAENRKNKAWPKCTVLLISFVSRVRDDLNILFELNFAPGKLPLNRVHKDDFLDLKPIFIPLYNQITLENII